MLSTGLLLSSSVVPTIAYNVKYKITIKKLGNVAFEI
jgi:hypothetical protein